MKLAQFLTEAERSRSLRPEKEDPKAPTTPARQAIRQAGDVGMVDTIKQVYKGRKKIRSNGDPVPGIEPPTDDKAKGARRRNFLYQRAKKAADDSEKTEVDFDPNNPVHVRKAGRELATAATGVEFGDTQDPVDAAISKVRGPALYQQRKADAVMAKRKEDNVTLGDRPKDLKKPDKPGRAYDKWQERRREQQKWDKKYGEVKDIDPKEFDELPTSDRMALGMDAAKGKATGTSEVEDALRDARTASELPRMRDPIKVGDEEIADSPYLRHAYQASGIDLPQQVSADNADEFVDMVLSAGLDPDKDTKTVPSADDLTSTGGRDRLTVTTPTARDLETIQKSAEDKGSDKAYLTPEVKQHQAKLRKALDTMDSEAIQKLAFKYDDKQITDDVVDNYLNRFQKDKFGKSTLSTAVQISGVQGDRQRAIYGGNLFDGEVPDEFKPKKNIGTNDNPKWVVDEDAPEDVIDLIAIKEKGMGKNNKWKNKELEEIYDKALDTRAREIVRTYLKQGAVDAYAPHEGMRSIKDMDLEHIFSLKGEKEDDDQSSGGYDHPSNWVYASGQLNKQRLADPLTQSSQKYVDPAPLADPEPSQTAIRKTFTTHLYDIAKNMTAASHPEYVGARGNITAAGRDKLRKDMNDKADMLGLFDDVQNTSEEELEARREALVAHFGMSPEQAAEAIPSLRSPENPAHMRTKGKVGSKRSGRIPGQVVVDPKTGEDLGTGRISRKSYEADPEAYSQDVRTLERDNVMYNKGIAALKKKFPKKKEEYILATPQGRELERKMARLGPSKVKDALKIDDIVDQDDLADI